MHSCVGVSIGRRSAWEDTEVAALQVVSKRRAEALPEDHPRIFAERSICTFILCKSAGMHVVYVCMYVCTVCMYYAIIFTGIILGDTQGGGGCCSRPHCRGDG